MLWIKKNWPLLLHLLMPRQWEQNCDCRALIVNNQHKQQWHNRDRKSQVFSLNIVHIRVFQMVSDLGAPNGDQKRLDVDGCLKSTSHNNDWHKVHTTGLQELTDNWYIELALNKKVMKTSWVYLPSMYSSSAIYFRIYRLRIHSFYENNHCYTNIDLLHWKSH